MMPQHMCHRGSTDVRRGVVRRIVRAMAAILIVAPLAGCNVDSWFDPSVTGYWEMTSTTIPILQRIDVIEPEDDLYARITQVTAEDLVPNDLAYRLSAGDFITIAVLDIFAPGVWERRTVPIDAGGFVRAPELGDVQAAGLRPQELENVLTDLYKIITTEPQVEVVVEEGRAFQYTIYGAIPGPGLYTLRDPDLRLLDALAAAGGVSSSLIDTIFVIRSVQLSERTEPYQRDGGSAQPLPPPVDAAPREPVDIESIIDQLEDDPSPGAFQDDRPPIDVDDLQPARPGTPPAVDIDQLPSGRRRPGAWVYLEERGEWVRLPDEGAVGPAPAPVERALYADRVIEIPVERLNRGESKFNIVVRPGDRIWVKPPDVGVVYIDGQIARPGVYTLPTAGDLTLSRLVAAAGGLGPLAIPDRVDLVRMVGSNREAVVRLNLGAIRQRTQPDVLLKRDDHIIIGTNFWAQPLAVIRNGFRATYGFGFLLDRNFGNDVFGPPPVTVNRF